MDAPAPVYFGCRSGLGHFFHVKGQRRRSLSATECGLPWPKVDQKLTPKSSTNQGDAALHHLDGWTAIAWHDYRIDSRPGSNGAAFLPTPDLTFDEAVELARATFPVDVPAELREVR